MRPGVDHERELDKIQAGDFRPRTLADVAAYAVPLVVGPLLWLWVSERSDAAEAWDADLWWPAHFAAALVLGFLLGGSGPPYVRSDVPLVGFFVAALLGVGEIATMLVTAPIDGAVLLPAGLLIEALVAFFAGIVATVGVLANRGLARAVRAVV